MCLRTILFSPSVKVQRCNNALWTTVTLMHQHLSPNLTASSLILWRNRNKEIGGGCCHLMWSLLHLTLRQSVRSCLVFVQQRETTSPQRLLILGPHDCAEWLDHQAQTQIQPTNVERSAENWMSCSDGATGGGGQRSKNCRHHNVPCQWPLPLSIIAIPGGNSNACTVTPSANRQGWLHNTPWYLQ